MKKNQDLFLEHIRENIREIIKSTGKLTFTKFKKATEKKLAILRRLEIIGEATKNLSESYKDRHPNIPWRKMAGLRDIIIHHYYELDDDIIWNVIQDELPKIEDQLKKDS